MLKLAISSITKPHIINPSEYLLAPSSDIKPWCRLYLILFDYPTEDSFPLTIALKTPFFNNCPYVDAEVKKANSLEHGKAVSLDRKPCQIIWASP